MKILVIGDFQGVFPVKLKRKLEKEEFDLVVGLGDYTGIKDWRPFLLDMFRRYDRGEERISAKEFFGKKKYKLILRKDELAGKDILRRINKLGRKVLFVFGNSDDEWYSYPFQRLWKVKKIRKNFIKNLKNMKEMTYGVRRFNGINFVGFGGYMDLSWYLKRKEGKEIIEKRKKRIGASRRRLFGNLKETRGERIFVFHYPPKGVFDIIREKGNPMKGRSSGIEFFREAIKRYKPKLVLCGHMHEYQGAKSVGGSLVVNPGDAGEGKYAVVDYPEDKKGNLKVKFVK